MKFAEIAKILIDYYKAKIQPYKELRINGVTYSATGYIKVTGHIWKAFEENAPELVCIVASIRTDYGTMVQMRYIQYSIEMLTVVRILNNPDVYKQLTPYLQDNKIETAMAIGLLKLTGENR